MCGMTAFAVRIVAKTFVSKMRTISSMSTSISGARRQSMSSMLDSLEGGLTAGACSCIVHENVYAAFAIDDGLYDFVHIVVLCHI